MATKNRQPHRKTSIYLTDALMDILRQRDLDPSDRSAFIRRAVHVYWVLLKTTTAPELKKLAENSRAVEARHGWEGMK